MLEKIHNNVNREQRISPERASPGMTSHDVRFRATFQSGYPCTVSAAQKLHVAYL